MALVEVLDGVEVLATYLDLPQDTLEVALAALPGDPKTERVARMVAENTWKLAGMPSQGGRIWRFTRKRVVKDWLILARRSVAVGAQPPPEEAEPEARELTDDQKRLLTGLARLGPDVLVEDVPPDELTQMAWEAGAPQQPGDETSRAEATGEEEIGPEEVRRDIDYWPDIDLDAAWTRIAEFWSDMYEEAGGGKYYPRWLVRRQVAFNIIQAAVDSRPELDPEMGEAYRSLGLSEEDPYEEDGQADERLEALLEAYHLRQFVDVMVQSLNDEEPEPDG